MPVNLKSLSGGGDKEVEAMMETASVLGIDLIEVVWNNRGGVPRWSKAQIAGFKVPVLGMINPVDEEINTSKWIDSTLWFYPDLRGNCWGFVFDCPENRENLYRSLSHGWFKIVSKKIKDEITKEAEDKGFSTVRATKTEVILKKTVREIDAEKQAKNLSDRLEDTLDKVKKLQRELDEAKSVRATQLEKRIVGTPVPAENE